MTTNWSGLGPAVDAYLARWSESRTGYEQLRRIERGGRPTRVGSGWLVSWLDFGKSYGIPRKDGSIAPAVRFLDDDDDGVPGVQYMDDYDLPAEIVGGRVVVAEGATIAGPEQVADSWSGSAAETGVWLAEREADMLADAIPHYVSADIVAEVNDAVVDMSVEHIFTTDIITPAGFAILEQPVLIEDLHPDTGALAEGVYNAVRAIGWRVEPEIAGRTGDGKWVKKGGVTLFLYSSVGDYVDVYVPSLREQLAIEAYVPDEWTTGTGVRDRVLFPLDVAPWAFETDWNTRTGAEHLPNTVISSIGQMRRWFLAFMRLCWQENIVRTPHHELTDRPMRRRWEREKPGTNLDLQVLRLRRNVYPDRGETGTGSPLGYRVKVRGFWRRQYYPSLGDARLPDGSMNPQSHRLVWIEEHWRGPEDGEIHSPFKMTSVVR